MRQALGQRDNAILAPVVIQGDVAVVGWTYGEEGARAFLRRDALRGWVVELWSGASLMLPATLASLGLSRTQADALRAEVAAAESAVGEAFGERFDRYPGTAFPGAAPRR